MIVSKRARVTILAIDDEAESLAQLSEVLIDAGYDCCCAQDAHTAAAAIRENTPDLIISDINLAGYNALAICEQLKHDAALPGVPVMFLSSSQVPDIIRRTHAVGGSYYLRKPFDTAVLLELVAKALPTPHFSRA